MCFTRSFCVNPVFVFLVLFFLMKMNIKIFIEIHTERMRMKNQKNDSLVSENSESDNTLTMKLNIFLLCAFQKCKLLFLFFVPNKYLHSRSLHFKCYVLSERFNKKNRKINLNFILLCVNQNKKSNTCKSSMFF
jgi:hypothetical protein